MTRAAPAALRHQSAARILARERRNRRETRRQGPARSRRHSATARPRLPLPAPRPRRGPASPAAAGAAGWAAGTGGAARAGDGASGRPRGAGGRGSGSAGSDRPPCHSAASGHGAERSPRRSSRSLRLPPARPCLPSPPPLSPPFAPRRSRWRPGPAPARTRGSRDRREAFPEPPRQRFAHLRLLFCRTVRGECRTGSARKATRMPGRSTCVNVGSCTW